jgi:uncharacterized protein
MSVTVRLSALGTNGFSGPSRLIAMKSKLLTFILLCITTQGCSNLFYLPSREHLMTPQEIGVKYEDIWIENEDEPKLHAWYLPAKDPIATVLFLHGNAENISTHFASVYWMPAKGLSVLMLDYRGYGLSEGEVSAEGMHRDVVRATRYLFEHYKLASSKFILFGQSLGGSMALYSAAQSDLHGLYSLVIAESAFASYHGIVQEKLASMWLTYPFQWFLPYLFNNKFSAIDVIDQVSPTPILLIHGMEDQVVDVSNSEELFTKLNGQCLFWEVPGGGHIAAFRDKQLRDDLVHYIKELPVP